MGGAFLEVDWDRRYREGFYTGPYDTHALVERFAPLIPEGTPVVDIPMGLGRDLLFVAGVGHPAYGLDRSEEAVARARQAAEDAHVSMSVVRGDARALPFRPGFAGGVLVFFFLIREIMSELSGLLMPGGILLYETFLKRQGFTEGPVNPDFLLNDGELPGCFPDLDLLSYEEGIFTVNGRQRALARYVGRKKR
jgi:SAM-dependent methyltransferase